MEVSPSVVKSSHEHNTNALKFTNDREIDQIQTNIVHLHALEATFNLHISDLREPSDHHCRAHDIAVSDDDPSSRPSFDLAPCLADKRHRVERLNVKQIRTRNIHGYDKKRRFQNMSNNSSIIAANWLPYSQ